MKTERMTIESNRDVRQTQEDLAKLERQEWWSWGTALVIIVALAGGVAVLSLVSEGTDVVTTRQREMVLRGLVPLILLFGLFVVRQQIQIVRLRRKFVTHMGIVATMEVLRRPSTEQRQGWQNRRQHPRYYFDQRVKVHAGKETFHGRTRDISESGIGVVVPDAIAVGSRVLLEFAVGERGKSITASGVLRHHRGFYNGFEFMELSMEDVESIRDVCVGETVPDLRDAT